MAWTPGQSQTASDRIPDGSDAGCLVGSRVGARAQQVVYFSGSGRQPAIVRVLKEATQFVPGLPVPGSPCPVQDFLIFFTDRSDETADLWFR